MCLTIAIGKWGNAMEWIGSKIKDLTTENNISIVKLAEMAGVSRQTVNDWINGQIPKGNHLIFLCKLFKISPDYLFSQGFDGAISVPVHRTRKTAKVTPSMQKDALEMAKEYDLLFRNAPESEILPVMRGRNRSDETAKKVAKELRKKQVFWMTAHPAMKTPSDLWKIWG